MSDIPKIIGVARYRSILAKTSLTIGQVYVRAALPPLPNPLSTASGQLTQAPVVLVDLELSAGLTGSCYLFCPRPDMMKALVAVIEALAHSVRGQPADPIDVSETLDQQLLLFGSTGLITMGRAALDMALWDGLAKSLGQPLVQVLGGTNRPVAAYDSSGLGISTADAVATEARQFVDNGFDHIKVRLGYPSVEEDISVLNAVRDRVGDAVGIMVDFNQSLTLNEARKRCVALDALNLVWIEEPIHAADLEGTAELVELCKTPIQIGENFHAPREAARALSIQASTLQMPDVMKIGGVTDWLRVAELTETAGMPVSSHLFPEISAHLLACVPNAHFLEYMNWTDAILEAPVQPDAGHVQPSAAPGIGLAWNEKAVDKYSVQL